MGNRAKSYSQAPFDPGLKPETKQFLDWVTTQLNQLTGQGIPPPATGLATFGANNINPAGSQIISSGSRVSSIATSLTAVPSSTSITFYWDGTNGSQPFKIYRDDGTITGPFITGSPYLVSGLTASTNYFFYFYWDETLQIIQPVRIVGAVGTPPVAFTSVNVLAGQQQILKNRIPLSPNLTTTGVTTTAAGTGATVVGGTGGGAGGYSFCPLSGAPVRLWGNPEWWTKEVKPCDKFVSVRTVTGRAGIFSPNHQAFTTLGLRPVAMWKPGYTALTEDGEERVEQVEAFTIPGATVDSYHATKGHIYSAWGFISHNIKLA